MYKTELIKVTADSFDVINRAAEIIKCGELVAFPTETVYGLGANGLDIEACKKIYKVKGRPDNKPLSLMVADRDMIESLVIISESADKLINKFLPGALTIILPSKNKQSTIGIRMPDNKIALELIRASNCPIAAPSANISGEALPITAQEVFKSFNGKIPLILDGGICQCGISSTIVDLTKDKPLILREGVISNEEIFNTLNFKE